MKLPVTVISGYLGAGKTTLVNHLLRNPGGLRLAVLVNEFGALPIDQDLIEAQEDGLMSISGGCVCCAYGSDMVGVLEDIRDASPGFDHVLLEASGVALPASIVTTVSLVQGLRADAAVVLADVEQVQKNARDKYLADTILRQLAQADIVLATKADLIDADRLEDVTAWLRKQASTAQIIPVSRGNVPAQVLLGAVPFAAKVRPGPSPHGNFDSGVLAPPHAVDAELLATALAADPSVTRAKGYVATADGLALIHVVGTRHEVSLASGEHQIGVVCIGVKGQFDFARLQSALAPSL